MFLVLTKYTVYSLRAASWRKRLGSRLPPLGSRVRVSVPPYGFRGGRNGVWVGFSRGFSRFPLPHIAFHHFFTLISSISFHFIRPCDGASGVVGRHPCYSRTYNLRASSHLVPRPDLCAGHALRIFIFLYIAYTTGAQEWHIVSLLGDVTSPTTVTHYVTMTSDYVF